MKAITDTAFQAIPGETRSQIVNHINPAHLDSRGGFEQILPFGEKYDLTYSTKWVKQINHSWSVPMVFRGFHAQKGKKCQGKLVENAGLKNMMYDVVIDARPESNTCGSFKVYPLLPIDSPNHNLLFVPRGFLHGMMSSPIDGTVSHLQYYVDSPYSKKDEITVSPRGLLDFIAKNVMETSNEAMWSLLKPFVDAVAKGGLELSEKDIVGVPIDKFLEQEKKNYTEKGKSWWRK